jgi:hypothetical protein
LVCNHDADLQEAAVRIVVTSTAKNAVGSAGRCAQSVREAARRAQKHAVRHVFYAVDEATAEDAKRGAGAELELRFEPTAPQLENLLAVWRECDPSDICVHLDGDDWLTPDALVRVGHMYERSDVWLTYGSFVRDDGVLDWLWHHHFGRRYTGPPRLEPWRASHLKTFRAGLVQKIPESYLRRPSGELYASCLDLVVMCSLLEMAGERYLVSTDVNAVYNYTHSHQAVAGGAAPPDMLIDSPEIMARAPLERLPERPW